MRVGVGAALLAGALAAGPVPVLAGHAVLLGPRSLYPATNRLRSRSDIPLVMRDAIEHIANRTRLLAVGPRIMGGEPAPPGAFPWMASLELKVRRKDAHFCGGAFIAPQWVITAAHCVTSNSAGAIDVLGGTNTLENGGALYPVDRVVVHEKYNTNTQDYDVALLHLSKAFPGKTVRLLTAADAKRYAAVGSLAVSAGWGLTAEGSDVSNVLRQVTVQVVSNQTCNGLAAYAGAVADNMLCAGFPEGGKDSCQGDSGGPLMVSDGNGDYFQAGIVSWGEGCGRPNKFGVYTRVSTIADWVAGKIGSRTTPTASNATPAASSTAAAASSAATKSAKAGPVNAVSATPRRFVNAAPMPRSRRGTPQGPQQAPPQATSQQTPPPQSPLQQTPPPQATFLLPLPRPRPPAILQKQQALPRVRTGRQFGAPINRKYAPSYPARAQARRNYRVQPAPVPMVPRKQPRRYYYYYYAPPYRSRPVIPPLFDLRLFR